MNGNEMDAEKLGRLQTAWKSLIKQAHLLEGSSSRPAVDSDLAKVAGELRRTAALIAKIEGFEIPPGSFVVGQSTRKRD